jgi:hypothetical protein
VSDRLEAEYLEYVRALGKADYDVLHKAGVSPWDIVVHGMVGVARMRVEGEMWWPDPEGRRAYVSPVRVHPRARLMEIATPQPWETARYGVLADLVAWHPTVPDRFALRRGDGVVLGSAPWRLSDEPSTELQVHRSPLDWLRAGTEGVVLLTRDPVEQRLLLLGVDQVRAADRTQGAELQRAIELGRREPRVLMPDDDDRKVLQLDARRPRSLRR